MTLFNNKEDGGMKKMVKLAVFLAAVLLLNGVALACYTYHYCHEVTATNMDDPQETETILVTLSYDCMSGSIQGAGLFGNMSMFFDAMNKQALAYGQGEAEGCVGYFKFHGDSEFVLTGIGYCLEKRWTLRGVQVPCDPI
jgi:hypothetical protein